MIIQRVLGQQYYLASNTKMDNINDSQGQELRVVADRMKAEHAKSMQVADKLIAALRRLLLRG